jgi:hypothetical protein
MKKVIDMIALRATSAFITVSLFGLGFMMGRALLLALLTY